MNQRITFAGFPPTLGVYDPEQSDVRGWIARTSNRAAAAGIAPEQAWRAIVDMVACTTLLPCEVWDAVERAYAARVPNSGGAA